MHRLYILVVQINRQQEPLSSASKGSNAASNEAEMSEICMLQFSIA